jgi:excisionase family DNA binding protein
MTEWLTTRDVAARTAKHRDTVMKAAEAGELHGHQTKRRGRWSFTPEAVAAWMYGRDSAAACGCRALKPLRGGRAA